MLSITDPRGGHRLKGRDERAAAGRGSTRGAPHGGGGDDAGGGLEGRDAESLDDGVDGVGVLLVLDRHGRVLGAARLDPQQRALEPHAVMRVALGLGARHCARAARPRPGLI